MEMLHIMKISNVSAPVPLGVGVGWSHRTVSQGQERKTWQWMTLKTRLQVSRLVLCSCTGHGLACSLRRAPPSVQYFLSYAMGYY